MTRVTRPDCAVMCNLIYIYIYIYTHIDFTVDEEKEWLNPSREKKKGTHRRKKVDKKSCATFLLCDPGWYVQRT